MKDKKWYSTKYFKTEEEAAIAYNELSRIHHGEFAYQNKVALEREEKEG